MTALRRQAVSVRGAWRELRASLCQCDRINGEVAFFAMELEVEPGREELLQHLLNLAEIGHARLIGLPVDIELLGLDPCRAVYDLLFVDGIGEGDQVIDGLALDNKAMAAYGKASPLVRLGSAGLIVATSNDGCASASMGDMGDTDCCSVPFCWATTLGTARVEKPTAKHKIIL